MPGHQVHRFGDRMMFGRSFWRLHVALDKPYLVFGRRHRMFFHDPGSAVLIARKIYPGDTQAEASALLHLEFDNMCTADPNLKKRLEVLAKKYYKNRRQSQKSKKKKKTRLLYL